MLTHVDARHTRFCEGDPGRMPRGQPVSLVWFVTRMLGYNARMYDGSFEDWSRRTESPVEGAAPAAQPPKG